MKEKVNGVGENVNRILVNFGNVDRFPVNFGAECMLAIRVHRFLVNLWTIDRFAVNLFCS